MTSNLRLPTILPTHQFKTTAVLIKEQLSTKNDNINVFDENVTNAESNSSSFDFAYKELKHNNSSTCQGAAEFNRKRIRDAYLSLGCIHRARAFNARNGRKNYQVKKNLQ